MNFCLKKTKIIFLAVSILNFSKLFSYVNAPLNFSQPYDINFRMRRWMIDEKKYAKLKLGGIIEAGSTDQSLNWGRQTVPLLSIYQDSQSSIAMVMGAQKDSEIYKLAQKLNNPMASVVDDGISGHFKLCGNYEGIDYTFYSQLNFDIKGIPGNFDFTAYLPFRDMKISSVKWEEQTDYKDPSSPLVKKFLTNDFCNLVSQLGNLDLGNWHETGISDLAFLLAWYYDFPQYKKFLQNVRILTRLGLTLPTGAKKDEDKTFSLPLGNDGAYSMPLSLGLDLFFKHKLRFCLDLEFTPFLDESRVRRLKTDMSQTDFLLLNKGEARKDFGNTWRFNMFLGAEHFIGGLSARIAFQYKKHHEDILHVKSQDFSNEIVNTAQNLKHWHSTNIIFQVDYDFFKNYPQSHIKPQLSLFYKWNINGRCIFFGDTFGGQLAFNF